MNKRELFRDVLNEGTAAEFEKAVFRRTLGVARRTRRIRIATRGALMALIAVGAIFISLPRKEVAIVTVPPPASEVELSHTLLRSEPFTGTIRTERGSHGLLTSSADNIAILKTGQADAGNLHFIDDEELLKFFEGHAVALVQHGPNHAELIFLEGEPQP